MPGLDWCFDASIIGLDDGSVLPFETHLELHFIEVARPARHHDHLFLPGPTQ